MMKNILRKKYKVVLGASLLLAVFAGGISLMGSNVSGQEEKPSAWALRCSGEETKKRCEMYQRLIVQETGQRVAEFAIGFPEKKDVARGAIVLPLGILLTEDLKLQIDDGSSFKFKVRYCAQEGCFAFIDLNNTILGMMKKGSDAKLKFSNIDGREVKIDMSLSGFTKSLSEISK